MRVTIHVWVEDDKYQATWKFLSHASMCESESRDVVIHHVRGIALQVISRWEEVPHEIVFNTHDGRPTPLATPAAREGGERP